MANREESQRQIDEMQGYDMEALIRSCNYEGGEEQAQAAESQNKSSARETFRPSQPVASSNQQMQIVQKSASQSEEEPFQIGQTYPQNLWYTGRGHWANADEGINQKNFPSVFEFLKTIRYQQKKLERKQKFMENPPDVDIGQISGHQKEKVGISVNMEQPHSIVDEVFSWERKFSTKDEILKKGNMAEHISTPRMTGRSLQLSPASVRNFQNNPFSPMTLSRAAVRNIHGQMNVGSISSGLNAQTANNARKHPLQAPAPTNSQQSPGHQISESKPNAPISGWPILQGQLNIREVILPSKKTITQFKNIGDCLDINFLQKYSVKQDKKRFFIFFKGKLYKFKTNSSNETSCKALNIKYCQIDLISLQKPTQTVVFSSKYGGSSTAGLNLEQCIIIRFLNKVVVLTNSVDQHQQQKQTSIKKWFELMKYFCVLVNVRCQYDIGQMIGKGNFAKVFEATHAAKKRKFALKTIQKTMFKDNIKSVLGLHDEINLLRKIRHPNVLQLYEIFESDNNIHLIIEHLNGKELFDQIKQRGQYQEQDAATILRCILNALVVLHSNNIVHRDLKPENLIFRDENLNSLVIIDFGLSTIIKDNQPLHTRCGSPGYVAPEILNNLGYGCKADIFSLGVIMYILLTSKFVFNAKDYSDILRRNKQCKVYFPKRLWENLSIDARSLCSLMLEKNADNRISAKEALEHKWFKKFPERIASVDNASNPLRKDFFDDPNDVRWIQQDNINIYNQNDKINVADSLNPPFDDEDPKEQTSQSNAQDSIKVSDLITSSPLMNKKKMQEQLRHINQHQLEQEKQNLFTTPLPQMRFLNKQTDSYNRPKVDPRFHKLLGGRIPRGPERQDKAKKDSQLPLIPPMLGKKNSGEQRSASQDVEYAAPARDMFMTPQVNNANQFAHQTTDQFKKNRAALFAITGVKVADGQSSNQRHASGSPQTQEASQGESHNIQSTQAQQKQQSYFKNNLTNIEEMKEDNASDIQQVQNSNMGVMNQIQEQQPVLVQDNSMHKAKRKDGGTGAGGQSEDEEECIATFSSDEDNDNDPSKRYGQLPLSQKITKAQENMNAGQVIDLRNKQILLQRMQQARNLAQNVQFQNLMRQNAGEGARNQQPSTNQQNAVNLPSGILNQLLMKNQPHSQNQMNLGNGEDFGGSMPGAAKQNLFQHQRDLSHQFQPNMLQPNLNQPDSAKHASLQMEQQVLSSQLQMSSQMALMNRNSFVGTNRHQTSRRSTQKCDIGPRRNRVGSDGTFPSFPVFLVDQSAQPANRDPKGAAAIGPRRAGGMRGLEKEVITNMYKQPRSMTPDDNVILQTDSQSDLQIGQVGQPPTGTHRNSVSVQLNNQPQPNLLAPGSANSGSAFNAANQGARQGPPGISASVDPSTEVSQAASNSQQKPQPMQATANQPIHFNFSGQATSQVGDSKAAGSSVSPASNALGQKYVSNEGQPKRPQQKQVDVIRNRLKLKMT